MRCPVCSSQSFTILVPAGKLDEECRVRERFVRERLTRRASRDELKDLTDFFHQTKAEIMQCSACTLLFRHELEQPAEETYSEDEYNPAVIDKQYPSYLNAFRAKQKPFRSLLPEKARVVEIGSHYGAFLETAREWGWEPEGVDIGKDTSRYTRSKGFTVHNKELSECKLEENSIDGVFIWNCFEQISDPKPLLTEAHRILKKNSLLVVRVPNGLFYAMCQNLVCELLAEAMAYNNLLGFPYLYGHSRATLERLIEPRGFRFELALNSELLTLPLPAHPDWAAREGRAINDQIHLLAGSVLRDRKGVLTGPWIELAFRTNLETEPEA